MWGTFHATANFWLMSGLAGQQCGSFDVKEFAVHRKEASLAHNAAGGSAESSKSGLFNASVGLQHDEI